MSANKPTKWDLMDSAMLLILLFYVLYLINR